MVLKLACHTLFKIQKKKKLFGFQVKIGDIKEIDFNYVNGYMGVHKNAWPLATLVVLITLSS